MFLIILFNLSLSLLLGFCYFMLGFLRLSSISLILSLIAIALHFCYVGRPFVLFNVLNHQFNIHHGPVYCSISLFYFNIQRFFFFFFFPRNFQGLGLFQQHHFVSLQEFSFQFTVLFLILQLISIIQSSLVCTTFLVSLGLLVWRLLISFAFFPCLFTLAYVSCFGT